MNAAAPPATKETTERTRSDDSVSPDIALEDVGSGDVGSGDVGSGDAVLDIDGISHRIGDRRILDDVSFSTPRGSLTALLGPNGAGKTTLFSLITRLYVTPWGRIRIGGFDISRRPGACLSQIGVVFQSRTLDLDLTVRRNLRYHGALRGMERNRIDARIDEELSRVGLSDRADDAVRRLSGGQARRVEIARALLHEPDLLLLDEPTAGVDEPTRKTIMNHIARLRERRGLTALWATHMTDEAAAADRLAILHRGKLVACGTPQAIMAKTATTTTGDAFRLLTTLAPPTRTR